MFMLDCHELTLSHLPADIVCAIIETGLESIEALRLVGKLTNGFNPFFPALFLTEYRLFVKRTAPLKKEYAE